MRCVAEARVFSPATGCARYGAVRVYTRACYLGRSYLSPSSLQGAAPLLYTTPLVLGCMIHGLIVRFTHDWLIAFRRPSSARPYIITAHTGTCVLLAYLLITACRVQGPSTRHMRTPRPYAPRDTLQTYPQNVSGLFQLASSLSPLSTYVRSLLHACMLLNLTRYFFRCTHRRDMCCGTYSQHHPCHPRGLFAALPPSTHSIRSRATIQLAHRCARTMCNGRAVSTSGTQPHLPIG